MTPSVLDEFQELARQSLRASRSDDDSESSMSDVLELALRNPGSRPLLADAFLAVLGVGGRDRIEGAAELVPYCMRTLRWAEVRTQLEAELTTSVSANDWRAVAVLNHALAAFEDTWEDATRYARYREAE